MRHVIAIDQGTTGSTVLILDEKLKLRGRGYKEFRQIYPKPGWVEHDLVALQREALPHVRTGRVDEDQTCFTRLLGRLDDLDFGDASLPLTHD